MNTFVVIIALTTAALIFGMASGRSDTEIDIGNRCLKTGQFVVDGHTFSCERVKVKETL